MGPVLAMDTLQLVLLILAVIIVLVLVVRLAGRKPASAEQAGGAGQQPGGEGQ